MGAKEIGVDLEEVRGRVGVNVIKIHSMKFSKN